MSRKEQAFVHFVGAMAVGYIAQKVVKHEAAILGVTALEVALAGFALQVLAQRIA